jgi:microsomal dipeptidase-like Zn-dependent dipeptidase
VLPYVDGQRNAVLIRPPYPVSTVTRTFHDAVFVADLHADALLWGRDPRQRNARGQVDLPRLEEGGVDLQVFSVVSKVPRSMNLVSNDSDTDSLPLLFLAAWRSPATWFSPKARALAQAHELAQLAEEAQLTLVLRRQDLSRAGIKGLLSLEGMHALEDGAEDALLQLHAAGFRMMGLAHFTDNAVAGSAHGLHKQGLTPLGRRLIPRMEALGITIDLAHASPAAMADTLALATKPLVVSHGGAEGNCRGPRNLPDDTLRRIAANGGVIGIGFWEGAICDASVQGIVDALLYAIQVAGIDHVGLGSDFDGSVATPFDASGLPLLTEALLVSGLSQADLRKLLGGNVRRVLGANLPG